VAFQELKKVHDLKVEEAKKSEDLLEALSTGLSTADSEKGFVEQLQDAKNQSTSIAAETQQAKLKLGHLNAELKELEPKAKKMEKENGDVQKTLDETKKVITAIEVQALVFS
jgi:structural maintenance of chromosome 2